MTMSYIRNTASLIDSSTVSGIGMGLLPSLYMVPLILLLIQKPCPSGLPEIFCSLLRRNSLLILIEYNQKELPVLTLTLSGSTCTYVPGTAVKPL